MLVRSLTFTRFERAHAEQMLSWRYPPPYELYNATDPASEGSIAWLLQPELHYYAVLNEAGRMIAFRCFGPDAQVNGGDYRENALDLGGGLHPDYTGQGLGRPVIAAAMNFGLSRFEPSLFRTTVAAFNHRAQKVCLSLGYRVSSEFVRSTDGTPFVVLMKPAVAMDLVIPVIG